MRKHFLMMMATAICALVITSCVKGPDDIPPSPTPTPETPEQVYDKAFKQYVGGTIASNQDWGFGASVVAGTRGFTRGGTGTTPGYYVSDNNFKEFKQEFYTQTLDSLPEGKTVDPKLRRSFEFISRGPFRFDFIFAYTLEENMEIGYYYYNPETETADQAKEVVLMSQFSKDLKDNKYIQWTSKSKPSEKDWTTYEAVDGYDIWTYPGALKAQTVRTRTFTLRDGSNDSKVENPKTVDVPKGYRVGFYMKNKDEKVYTNCYKNKNEGDNFFAVLSSENKDDMTNHIRNAYVVGIEDLALNNGVCDHDCNDVIIAVHKNIETTFPLLVVPEKVSKTWRVIAEDLTVSDVNLDFDFNDIVLDVTLTKTGADCVLQAAGAELPIAINGEYDKLEVHKLFGVEDKVMVNTNSKVGKHKDNVPPVKFQITGSFKSVDDVLIEVKRDDGKWHKLYAKRGDAACKILVTTDFVWPDEQQSIKLKYPKFEDWVKDPSVVWYPNE